ncbi:hypothetical protein PALA19_00581 [Pseudomonas aeruginosa]|nr:hypothetical protein PALA19_00581 [Pseudomonas aeruginosa]
MPFTETVHKFTRKEISADEAVAHLKEQGLFNIALMTLLEEYLEAKLGRDSYYPDDAY